MLQTNTHKASRANKQVRVTSPIHRGDYFTDLLILLGFSSFHCTAAALRAFIVIINVCWISFPSSLRRCVIATETFKGVFFFCPVTLFFFFFFFELEMFKTHESALNCILAIDFSRKDKTEVMRKKCLFQMN